MQKYLVDGGVVLQVRSTQASHTHALFAQLMRQCIDEDSILTVHFDKVRIEG